MSQESKKYNIQETPAFDCASDYFSLLHQMTLALMNATSEDLMRKILTQTAALVALTDGHIDLVDSQNELLTRKASIGLFESDGIVACTSGLGAEGMSLATGKPLIINDYKNWSGLHHDPAYSSRIQALITLPLKYEDKILAILTLAATQKHTKFNDKETELLSKLANLAATILQSVRLRETLEAELKQSKEAAAILTENKEHFKRIAENMTDVIVEIDRNKVIQYVSPSCQYVLGYTPEQLLSSPVIQYIIEDDVSIASDIFQTLSIGGTVRNVELRLRHQNEQPVWIEFAAKPMLDQNGDFAGSVISYRDISDRKQAEDQLRYLSHNDVLTGLYNRVFFEQIIERYEGVSASRGVIICDVDGLKLTNDSLGHHAGDRLLVEAAKVIKDAAGEHVAARIGGDEFAIYMRNCSNEAVGRTAYKIKENLSQYNGSHNFLPLSISVGYGFSDSTVRSVYDIIKEADKYMYHHKMESSTRSPMAKRIMDFVETRDLQLWYHVQHLEELLTRFAVGVKAVELAQIKLLARFHDIGKIGVPRELLSTPGRLTRKQQSEVKKHTEVGYRIAKSDLELMPIADMILKHHEWWNGKGYPLGLKETQIPLECRMLSIVDAYDAMTNDRPYRKAVPKEQAIQEIKKCAGTQFDPELANIFSEVISAI